MSTLWKWVIGGTLTAFGVAILITIIVASKSESPQQTYVPPPTPTPGVTPTPVGHTSPTGEWKQETLPNGKWQQSLRIRIPGKKEATPWSPRVKLSGLCKKDANGDYRGEYVDAGKANFSTFPPRNVWIVRYESSIASHGYCFAIDGVKHLPSKWYRAKKGQFLESSLLKGIVTSGPGQIRSEVNYSDICFRSESDEESYVTFIWLPIEDYLRSKRP